MTEPTKRPSLRTTLTATFRKKETQAEPPDDSTEPSRDELLTKLTALVKEWFVVLDILDHVAEQVQKGSMFRSEALLRCQIAKANAIIDFALTGDELETTIRPSDDLVDAHKQAEDTLVEAELAVQVQDFAVERAGSLMAAMSVVHEDRLALIEAELVKLLQLLFPGRFFFAAPASPTSPTNNSNIDKRLAEAWELLESQKKTTSPIDKFFRDAISAADVRDNRRLEFYERMMSAGKIPRP